MNRTRFDNLLRAANISHIDPAIEIPAMLEALCANGDPASVDLIGRIYCGSVPAKMDADKAIRKIDRRHATLEETLWYATANRRENVGLIALGTMWQQMRHDSASKYVSRHVAWLKAWSNGGGWILTCRTESDADLWWSNQNDGEVSFVTGPLNISCHE